MTKMVKAVDIDGKTYDVLTSQLSWRPSAYGITIKEGRVLLLKQKQGYDLPGGGVELGETLEEAVVREVKEESGLIVSNPELVAAHTSFFKLPGREDPFVQSVLLYYSCNYESGDISNEGFDEWEKQYAEMAEWFPLQELDTITVASTNDFRPYVQRLIR